MPPRNAHDFVPWRTFAWTIGTAGAVYLGVLGLYVVPSIESVKNDRIEDARYKGETGTEIKNIVAAIAEIRRDVRDFVTAQEAEERAKRRSR